MGTRIENTVVFGGGSSLESLGFRNVPDGTWKIKTGSFVGFGDNVIPLTANFSSSCSASHNNCTWYTMEASGRNKVNGKDACYVYSWCRQSFERGALETSGNATAYNVFLPLFYDMDLTAVQTNIKSGTITSWLEKE